MDSKRMVFQNKEIRRTLRNGEWWFVITQPCHPVTIGHNLRYSCAGYYLYPVTHHVTPVEFI